MLSGKVSAGGLIPRSRAAAPRRWLEVVGASVAMLLAGATAAAAQDYRPPFFAGGDVQSAPFNQLYYGQPHNSYDHSDRLTNWLFTGYRALEIDVIDREDWEDDAHGPYVSHDLDPKRANCNNEPKQRLANCLDAVLNWLDANNSTVPIVVLVDMKASWDPASAWKSDEVADLDNWIRNYLGNRMYKYTDLRTALGGSKDSNMRQLLKDKGWPAVRTIENKRIRAPGPLRNGKAGRRPAALADNDKIIVALTGGHLGSVNQNMRDAVFHHLDRSPSTFMCPDVDAGDPDEISGSIDGMSKADSDYFICSNLEVGDHMETTLNRSAEYNQMIHIWDSSGDFYNTSYAYNYIVTAQGGSILGWDFDIDLNQRGAPRPIWTGSIPLVGLRRSLPGYFEMINEATGECLDVNGARYKDGSIIIDSPCHGGDNQRWVYTAEGQLRPKGDNKYCLDIDGGKTGHGRKLHLWDCDGGRSEKWAIDENGYFHSIYDNNYCVTLRSNDLEFEVNGCELATARQRFVLRKVPDWLPTNY